jgi:hypothetical protein
MKIQEERRTITSQQPGSSSRIDSAREIRLLTLRGPLAASRGALWGDLAQDIAWISSTIGATPDWVSACASASDQGSGMAALDVTLGFGDARLAQIQLRHGQQRRATAHTRRGQLALVQDEGERRARVHGTRVVDAIAAAKRSLSEGGEPIQLRWERPLEAPRLMA